ncbi:MAG: thiol-disulfide oxidoreductase DCC family protein [Hyphomicrobium sp.]|nr:thiol-disulfide oxidoreductase DCC family protein [Hyphomicrobium sp.]PPD07626.1 MAG: thiol-disulfide oxidoreductase [Hyphomicrobium sp.]
MNREAIWLFDSVCLLCSGAVRYTLQHEKAPTIRFVAIQSRDGRTRARQYGIDPDEPDSFLFIEDGRALTKSDGVLALVQHLNGPARLATIGRVVPRIVRDWLYDRIAGNRYRLFGRSETCLRPDAATRGRFVLPEELA